MSFLLRQQSTWSVNFKGCRATFSYVPVWYTLSQMPEKHLTANLLWIWMFCWRRNTNTLVHSIKWMSSIAPWIRDLKCSFNLVSVAICVEVAISHRIYLSETDYWKRQGLGSVQWLLIGWRLIWICKKWAGFMWTKGLEKSRERSFTWTFSHSL